MKKKCSIIYLYILERLNERNGFNRILTRKEFYYLLGTALRIPRRYKKMLLNEMVDLKLVKTFGISNSKVEVIYNLPAY